MKKLIAFIAFLALTPAFALANTVQVYPSITNANGGTKFAKDISVCIDIDGNRTCETGVPNFNVPLGSSYRVVLTPPAGYSATMHGDCDGVVQGEEASIVCFADYQDGAPIVQTPPPAPQPAPTVETPSPSGGTTVSIPSGDVVGSSVSSEEAAEIKALQAQILQLLLQLIDLLNKRIAELQSQQ